MAQTVVNEGQSSIVRFLKPFSGFEQIYQGKPSSQPVAFPGGLDLYAQKKAVGYDPDLSAGMTVPLGALVRIWIPLTISGGTVLSLYQYQIIWRLRTVADFVTGQSTGQVSSVQAYSGYHLGIDPFGQPDATDANNKLKRYFLPGAMQTAAFPQAQPSGPLAGQPGVVQLQGQVLQPIATSSWKPPLTPAGRDAAWQQGVYPDANPLAFGPAFVMYEFEAMGDEMAILASRSDATEDTTWDFTTSEGDGDKPFSTTYGNNAGASAVNPYSAILVMVGTK